MLLSHKTGKNTGLIDIFTSIKLLSQHSWYKFYSIFCIIINTNSSMQDSEFIKCFEDINQNGCTAAQHKTCLTQSLSSLMMHKMKITQPNSNHCILGSFEINIYFIVNCVYILWKLLKQKTWISQEEFYRSTGIDLPFKNYTHIFVLDWRWIPLSVNLDVDELE